MATGTEARAAGVGGGGVAERVAQGVVDGDRFMLSRAITLVESTRADHRGLGAQILEQALQRRAQRAAAGDARATATLRVGISGPPGVGKSTFIEALGKFLIRERQARVAVVAIDPTSQESQGSILGDKTRMQELSMMRHAFVRPCAAGHRHLGGLALHSDEVVMLCEAGGYDIVLIETVGVGQSETLVTEIADMCVLLLPPAGGDELQGIKRGIVETADLIVVNKADGDMLMAAKRAQSHYANALRVMQSAARAAPDPHHGGTADADADAALHAHAHAHRGGAATSASWTPRVALCSAVTNNGVVEICQAIFDFQQECERCGELARKRARQRRAIMWRKAEVCVCLNPTP